MPSLQARILRGLLRVTVKRHLQRHCDSTAAIVPAMRRAFEARDRYNVRVPSGMRVVPIDQDGIRGEWVMRDDVTARDRAIMYLHGGGLVACRPLSHRPFTLALARATGAPVFVPDYRLAPEHPYPAALDDAVAAFDAMCLRIPGARIVLGGDSGGGNLALATLLRLRARGDARPAAGTFVLSPWTDLANTGASVRTNVRSEDMLVAAGDTVANAYAPRALWGDPFVSPLRGDYSGAPPLLIFASRSEMLLDDGRRLAETTQAQGVDTTLVLEHGLPHAWPLFPSLPESRRAFATIAAFVARCWSNAAVAVTVERAHA